jgi:hypothetical protein
MASLVTVLLWGSYTDAYGVPATGSVTVISSELLSSSVESNVVQPVNETVVLDEAGRFELVVPAVNSPGWMPNDWTYLVKEDLSTGVRTRRIAVPYNAVAGMLNIKDATEALA